MTTAKYIDSSNLSRAAEAAVLNVPEKLRHLRSLIRVSNPIRILFFSYRSGFFSFETLSCLSSVKTEIDCFDNPDDLVESHKTYDIAIICNHVVTEHCIHDLIRFSNPRTLIVSWTWDNHHSLKSNLRTVALADVVLPGHAFCIDDLHLSQNVIGSHFPLCTGQWSPTLVQAGINSSQSAIRSDRLYGGYVNWPLGSRPEILARLTTELPPTAIKIIEPVDRDSYFRQSAEDRFTDWLRHKVHLVISIQNDLSCRLFDSLISGQVPLIARDCFDLDDVIPPTIQNELSIVRFDNYSTECIRQAWAEGLRKFDETGEEGISRRHLFALNYHHAEVRIGQMVDYIINMAESGNVETSVDDRGVRRTLTLQR